MAATTMVESDISTAPNAGESTRPTPRNAPASSPCATAMDAVPSASRRTRPAAVVVDSIQTVFTEQLTSAPATDQPLSVTVYWGGREPQDLYASPSQWHPKLRYVPVLSRAPDSWTGAHGYVQKTLLADAPDLSGTVVYACGSDAMIQSAKAALTQAGLPDRRFYSDAFVPSGA